MVIENIAKPLAESYKALLSEFRPDWDVEIRSGDYNLYKLGFVNEGVSGSVHGGAVWYQMRLTFENG